MKTNQLMTHLFNTNASVDAHNNALYTLSRTDKAQIKAVNIIIQADQVLFGYHFHILK